MFFCFVHQRGGNANHLLYSLSPYLRTGFPIPSHPPYSCQKSFFLFSSVSVSDQRQPRAAVTCWNFSLKLVINGTAKQVSAVVWHGETLVFSPLQPLWATAELESGSTFVKLVLQWKLKKVLQNWPCYTVQRLLKLVSQRGCIEVSAKSFNM